jgi:2-haloalkanoic acid dehalogenase type II
MRSHPIPPLHAVTLDLDDTLWPVGPTIVRAEQVLQDWLRAHAPATASAYPVQRMQALRAQVARDLPGMGHDLTALRLHTIRWALEDSGDDPALAEPAFEVFFAERQRVTFYPDVEAALHRLAARWPLLALTNGNAQLQATGLSRWFVGSVNASSVGVAKPDARIFAAACQTLRLQPEQVLHVGDDWRCDVQGARAAGLHSAWVLRPDATPATGAPATTSAAGLHLTVSHLLELADQLGA